MARIDWACWAARTSVGASSAHWYPASTICSRSASPINRSIFFLNTQRCDTIQLLLYESATARTTSGPGSRPASTPCGRVDVAVTADTELSYLVFPEFNRDDLSLLTIVANLAAVALEKAKADVEAEKKRIEVMKNRLKGVLGVAIKVVKQDWKAVAEEAAKFIGGQLIDEISTSRLAELKAQLEQATARLHSLEDMAMLQAIETASLGLEEAAGALDDAGKDIRDALVEALDAVALGADPRLQTVRGRCDHMDEVDRAIARLTGLKVDSPYDVGANKESARRIVGDSSTQAACGSARSRS